MKKLIYILVSCIISLSCADETKNKDLEISTEEAIEIPNIEAIRAPEKPNFEKLASQKLADYFDLLRLQQEHPEFEQDLLLQLKSFSENDTLFLNKYQNIKSIENIRQTGDIIQVADSVQQIKLYFDVITDKMTIADSTLAKILFKNIVMENSSTKSYKIQFKKLN